jgi:hypothetical protein
MWMKFRSMTIASAGFLLTAFTIPDDELMLDGVNRSEMTEVSYSFKCADLRVRVSYRMTHLDPHKVPLRDAMRATLSKLSVSGRQIKPADFEQAGQMFRSFAFVERVEARCYRGRVDLWVIGLPLQPWLDFLEGRLPDRPDTTIRSIDISPEGAVTTRQ